jgi:RNA methyltransferase, TrmH family
MISKAKSKYIKSLQVKKYRIQEQCFLVEGAKSVEEVVHSAFEVQMIVATQSFLDTSKVLLPKETEVLVANESELSELGSLQTNDSIMAVVRMKPNKELTVRANEFALALDDIRDPGNLGTIIRTADWYGLSKVIASEETADFYNPKAISATMGSFCRVEIYYTNLAAYLKDCSVPVYGTFLDGQSVHGFSFADQGLIVIGNESRGISAEVEKCIKTKITIPRFGKAESLNAGVATAVVLDNLRRSKK